ncbi:GTPase Der [Cupriavidus laharis]|uniref:GTPase Der n=1 Tax=Cupriavidus laharis TaxID=151654 RepID=A0ABN7Y426_9BURK|nr:dynamin family protein [Cupriavidus laharis]CAG9168073.1 GTPase Der [Cupriavidus laharis]
MNLRDYERVKFDLAELLRALAVEAEKSAPGSQDHVRELFARLAEDRFNLVVVGRFSRGKTSLMNAMLGTERLPVGILPLTSVITTVAYGSPERAIVSYQEARRPPLEIALDALAEYVTQQRNPGNAKRIRTAEIRLNAELLRRGFHFIDTPGLGSPVWENTRTTEDFLPEADAFLLVTSYDSPLSAEELRIARMARSAAKRIFVALNKQDVVCEADRHEALRYVQDQLRVEAGMEEPHVLSISARDAMAACLAHDAGGLQASGLPELQAALVRFLVDEKRDEFLLRFCDRIEDAAGELLPATAASRLREQLYALSQRIADEQPAGARRSAIAESEAQPPGSARAPAPCEVCAHVGKQCFDYLCRFQYELLTDAAVRQRHAEQGGFCDLHTWQYWGLASPRGTCIAYSPLLERLSERLLETVPVSSQTDPDSRPPMTGRACMLCTVRARAEHHAIDAVVRRLQADPDRTIDTLSAICLSHHRLLLAAIADPALRRRVLSREAALLYRLAEDMRRYATKFDALHRGLASDEETRAAQSAIAVLAGQRNMRMSGMDEESL